MRPENKSTCAENYLHILSLITLVDSVTHFCIHAVPMKKINSVTVAEALTKQFDLIGCPYYINNDNDGNLFYEIMQGIYETLPVSWPLAT